MLASVQPLPPVPFLRPNAIPIVAPVPTSTPQPLHAQSPATPTIVPLTEAQKEAKRTKYYALVALSKSIMEKVAATKDRKQKGLLMQMLKTKTK